MDRFYFDIIFRWIVFLALLIATIKEAREFVTLRKSKVLIFSLFLFYYVIASVFYTTGWIRPFLPESKLSQLEISEGIGKIYGTAKSDLVYLENNGRKSFYFDFSLCIPYIDEKSLKDQHLKIWHKGRMVYQVSKNGEIIFSIENANSNVKIYNLIVVPLGYLIVLFCDCYICFAFLYHLKMKKIGKNKNKEERCP